MRAGPREKIFFKPSSVKAAIVTCGGLCPGLNDVIRQLVITLDEYGVTDIKGRVSSRACSHTFTLTLTLTLILTDALTH